MMKPTETPPELEKRLDEPVCLHLRENFCVPRSCPLHRFRSSLRSRKKGIVVENGANSCVGRVKRDNSEKLTAMKPSG
jgi:hypothetical protein